MLIAIIILAAIIFLIVSLVNTRKKAKKRSEELGVKVSVALQHVEGLPIALGTLSNLLACQDKLVIDSKKLSFDVPYDRVIKYSTQNVSGGASKIKSPLFVVHYYDKSGAQQSITFTSTMFDLNKFVIDFTKALNRPENSLEVGENGTVSL